MRAKRTDANHREIISTLRILGWQVADTHDLPNFVDAVACRGLDVRLIEIKAPKGTLTSSQDFMVSNGWPIKILRSVDDAVNLR